MKMTKVKHLELVDAWWSGKLEICRFGTNWEGAKLPPDPLADPDHYRIRPQPKLRPWKPEEVPVGALVTYKSYEPSTCRGIIMHVTGSKVWTTFDTEVDKDLDYMLSEHVHSLDGGKTWKPCGVEE